MLIVLALFGVLIGGGTLLATQLGDGQTAGGVPSGSPGTPDTPHATASETAAGPSGPTSEYESLAGAATCENETFRVYVPTGWYTLDRAPNAEPDPGEEPGESPECRRFAPEAIDITDAPRFAERAAPGVSLEVIVLDEDTGIGHFETPVARSEVTLSGLPGDRLEFGATGGAEQDGRAALQIVIDLEGEAPPDVPSAPVLLAWYSALAEDYEEHLPAFLQLLASFEMLDGSTAAAREAAVETLFSETDTCERADAELVLTFPDDWYANTEYESIQACTFFAPRFYEIEALDAVPQGVEVVVRLAEGPVAPPGDVVLWDQRIVGDWPVARYEVVSRGDGSPVGERRYRYAIGISGELPNEASSEPYLLLETSTSFEGDYPLARAVIDAMVERLEAR